MVCQGAWNGGGPCVAAAAMPSSRRGRNIGPVGDNCSSMPDMELGGKLGEEREEEETPERASSLGQGSDHSGEFGGVGPRGPARMRGRRAPSLGSSGASSDDESDSGGRVRRSHRPPWVRSLSDSVAVQQAVCRGGEAPATPGRRCASVPAVLAPRPRGTPRENREGPRPGISLSQARLIIPRSISEYLECCRFARPHSDGLLWVCTVPEGIFATCRGVVPRALSEGLLGGRLCAQSPPGRQGSQPGGEERPPPKPRIPVNKLKQGMVMEGRIVRTAPVGLFVDVGATRQGLLRWRDSRGVPRQLLRRDQVLSNMTVIHVWPKKRRFSLRIDGIGVDDENLEEEAYGEILRRIAGWAGVTLPPEEKEASVSKPSAARARRAAQGGKFGPRSRGKGKGGRPPETTPTAQDAASAPDARTAEATPCGHGHRGRRRRWAAVGASPEKPPACEEGAGGGKGSRRPGAARALRGGGKGRAEWRRKPVAE
uniref:S1 motif domain-containing protein n=1 Tax=Alexandrium monilatum TaxID=311494 RepID=A0A6T0XMT8_9DINO